MKKNWKKAVALFLCLMTIGGLTACGSSGGDTENKTYVVSTEPTYPPFDTTDEEGNLTGFDMDLMQAIADDQGFEVEFQSLEFDALIPSLDSGNSDIVIAGMNVTDERAEQVDFSDPYYTQGVVCMTKKGNTEITGWDSFTEGSGYKVAVQSGTTQADLATKMKENGLIAEVVQLNQNTTALQQLANGDVDAFFLDSPVATDILASQGDKYQIMDNYAMAEDSEADVAIAVKKGNSELLDMINEGLANVKEDGTYDKLAEKWKLGM